MSAATPPATIPRPTSAPVAAPPLPHRERHRLRRRLARQDRLGARLADLATVAEVLRRAEVLVADGWVQDAWFGYDTPSGPRVSHLPGGLTAAVAAAADRFCLVASVHAATAAGPGTRLTRAERPTADRAVDTVWRTLAGAGSTPAGPHLPPPYVGALRRLDLTRWNDVPGRTAQEVRSLLQRAGGLVEEDRGNLVAARAALG